VLKQGLGKNWETRDQYLNGFENTPSVDSTGRPVRNAKEYVECAMEAGLRRHQIWDEGPPIEVEVHRTIIDFTRQRSEAQQAANSERQTAKFQRPSCQVYSPKTVAISAAVAASLLEKKIDPIYPARATENHVSGTVVLRATISAEGRVEELGVVSGPTLLQQAAVHAVRQWTYRPYLLDERPVRLETTIKVVFAPHPQQKF